ncbi:MAG TPA: PQQ-dependent sugar dehydrogenase [Verrucomicrobiae bacterium]|nr:PQQ-dependent sugar dehydrogenase [Verrucomicrobiae bacterium]
MASNGIRSCRAIMAVGVALWCHSAAGQLVRAPNTTLNLPAELPAGSFGFTNFVTNAFSQPLCVLTAPGETNRLFVLEKGGGTPVTGRIRIVPSLTVPTNMLTFLALGVTNDSESGLLGMAFHPGYSSNRQFFVFYSFNVGASRYQRISRFLVSTNDPNAADPLSEVPLITQFDQAGNHNGGDIHFGLDGYLYASLGDEGGGGDTYANSQTITNDFFAGIIRMDVDRRVGNLVPNPHPAVHTNTYLVPADNPFVGATNYNGLPINPNQVRTEFWATGLRNPWRFSFDPATGELWCGDVGQSTLEEIDIIARGKNYGWAWREGTNAYTTSPWGATPPPGFAPTEPVWVYGRTLGQSVTGGVLYRGTRFPELNGAYVFADFGSGNVWALWRGAGGVTVQLLAVETGLVAFGVNPTNGDILVANINTGRIRRLVRTSVTGVPPPALLSQTGVFSNLAALTPHAGIVPYDINVPFWSDHATKTRWFSIPNTADDMVFDRDLGWSAPPGTVWVKHFDLETNRGDASSRSASRRVSWSRQPMPPMASPTGGRIRATPRWCQRRGWIRPSILSRAGPTGFKSGGTLGGTSASRATRRRPDLRSASIPAR